MKNKYFIYIFFIFFSGCAGVEYNILTGKQNLTFISEEKEIKLGRKIAREVADRYKIIKDPKLRDRVNKIGYRLVEVCDRKSLVYYFEIIDEKKDERGEEPNAFALPGGYIYINKKLLQMLENDNEIAAVLAHELSHVVLRHNILKLQEVIGTQTLLAILSTKAPDIQTVKKSQSALLLLLLSYSKERELEADRLALKYLKKANFDPKGMITALKKLQEYQFKSPLKKYYLHSHPYLDERIKLIEMELQTAISPLKDY